MLQKLRNFIERIRPRKREYLRLAVTADRVTLYADGRESWHFRWDEVTRVETYKHDLFTVDLICLNFFIEGRQMMCPTDEEIQGFDLLCEHLQSRFPSIDEHWWQQVAFPAFAPNSRVLYEKTPP